MTLTKQYIVGLLNGKIQGKCHLELLGTLSQQNLLYQSKTPLFAVLSTYPSFPFYWADPRAGVNYSKNSGSHFCVVYHSDLTIFQICFKSKTTDFVIAAFIGKKVQSKVK